MAQQDKTDFYWNGVLSGAVNNLYYDLINVDVVHPPYATTYRNSSFFLKTRLGYVVEEKWDNRRTDGWAVKDVYIARDSDKNNLQCDDMSGTVYVLAQKPGRKKIFYATIDNGCIVGNFSSKTERETTFIDYCSDWKLLITNFVKGEKTDMDDCWTPTGDPHATHKSEINPGIQMNKYTLGTTVGLFSDDNVESGYYDFTGAITEAGNYLLVYYSRNGESDGFAGQVRMITGTEQYGGVTRIVVDSPWLGFKTVDATQFEEGEEKIVQGGGLKYAVFSDWGEVVGFTDKHEIHIIYDPTENETISVYNQYSDLGHADIIGVASSNEKIFVLTDNGYIHYNNGSGGYNKFFIQDDMFAGVDKIAISTYRDMIVTFGRTSISVGIPDDANKFYTMYNQDAVEGIRSRYAFAEYEGDLLYVSSSKRLMALSIANNIGKYILQAEDVGDMINGKLSTMLYYDEVSIGNTDNDLRVFVNTSSTPYVDGTDDIHVQRYAGNNDMTHIYKFNTLFKVRTEDHVDNLIITGVKDGIYFGQQGLFKRDVDDNGDYGMDYDGEHHSPYKVKINAYMIENENNGLDGHPLLFQLAKLNSLILTLGPGIYTSATKLKIETYSKGIGLYREYELNGDYNSWLGLITDMYTGADTTIDECIIDGIKQDGQSQIGLECPSKKLSPKSLVPENPRCDSYKEFLIQDHSICYNNTLYRLSPTMPLTFKLGDNQNYSTQIKIELTSGNGDIVSFGGRLAELYLAPLGLTGPDGEYQLQPNADC